MLKFRYYSPFWTMWYSEIHYNKLITDIKNIKDFFKRLKGHNDEM